MALSKLFEELDVKEVDELLVVGTIKPVKYNYAKYAGVRLFGSQIVRKVKGKTTPTLYEKLKLVIKGFNDYEKEAILTILLTI